MRLDVLGIESILAGLFVAVIGSSKNARSVLIYPSDTVSDVHLLPLAGIQSHDDLIEHWNIELPREIKETLLIMSRNEYQMLEERD